MKKIFLILALLLLLIPLAFAKSGQVPLLAVKESTKEGSAADLFLEIQPGKGRVFLETIPLSKFDTQISTRFAKDIACSYLEKDCSRYDFFYTIKANSPIIGGPSAGGAIAVLTAAVLEGVDIDEDVAMTGTINSGSIIGPVGGLQAKIEAAAESGITTVLIPTGGRFMKELNLTLDLADYGKKFDVAVVEVGNLGDALFYFTGKRFKENIPELEISKEYTKTMKSLADTLCNRTEELQKEIFEFVLVDKSIIDEDFLKAEETSANLTEKGNDAFDDKRYYSSASYCFGANVNYRRMLLRMNGYGDFDKVEEDIEDFEKRLLDTPIKTITDLQAYMIVKERLKDASSSLENARESEKPEIELGYAIERLYSADSWSKFFGVKGKEFEFDKEILEESCVKKLAEAEERYQYADLFLPAGLKATRAELDYAYEDRDSGNFELCLFKASKAKAEADIILGSVGVGEEQVEFVVENKLDAVRRVIAEQQAKEIFPILGYSYYEYANQLKGDKSFSAMLYAEYALEMSNLDIYFEKKSFGFGNIMLREDVALFIAGILMGVIAVLLIKSILKPKKRKKKR